METACKTVCGTVEGITYWNEQTGYAVLRVTVGEESITVVGNTAAVAVGEVISADGAFRDHPTYGRQFCALLIRCELPSDANAVRQFLASGVVKGIGPKTAAKLTERYGADTLSVIANDPNKLTEFRGISLRKAGEIGQQLRQFLGVHELMAFAAANNIPTEKAIAIWDLWKERALPMIRENAYCLCCEDLELDFAFVDRIGLKQDEDALRQERLRAGIWCVLTDAARAGSACLPRQKLRADAVELLDIDTETAETAIDTLCAAGELSAYDGDEEESVYLNRYYEAEDYTAQRLALLMQQPAVGRPTLAREIAALEQVQDIAFGALQKKAIAAAVTNRAFILTGGPGTGKTTIIRAILELLEQQGEQVLLAAPTGRAAKRMGELTGREAKTIHRLLEVKPGTRGREFVHDERCRLQADTVIIDEMSMVDSLLMKSLLKGMDFSTRLILVGDSEQLPSVSAGNVLAELIASDTLPMVHLDQVFRQAAESGIVTNAHRIAAGELPVSGDAQGDCFLALRGKGAATRDWLTDVVARRLPEKYGFLPLRDIQVITPTRTGALGTGDLNAALQAALNPPAPDKQEYATANRIFREGDRVMQIRNNYDITWTSQATGEPGMGIYNGDIGNITMVDLGSATLGIDFDGREVFYPFDGADELEHAYAVTVHKAQGSEFLAVVLAVGGCPQPLLYRNLLYTAVTRAKKLLLIAGSGAELTTMVLSTRKSERCTNLGEMLRRYCGM